MPAIDGMVIDRGVMKTKVLLILAGLVIGLIAIVLAWQGNPPNMGVCVACFMRDVAGGLKFHSAATVQYMRPEVFSFVIGAFAASLIFREFRATAGSAPLLRFSLGFFMMLGCLVFLGCPLRMVLRIGAGDLNAVVGLVGFAAGIGIGSLFIRKGFALPKEYSQSRFDGAALPVISGVMLILVLLAGGLFARSESGPGASHAPVWMAIVGGLAIGWIVQRTRFCFIGTVRNVLLMKDFSMALGVLALILTVFVASVWMGDFKWGFEGQPIAHTDGVWNFLSMALVGLCGTLISGCPLRQLVKAGQGSSDAGVAALGLLVGAAVAHNFALASSPAGPTEGGRLIVILGLLFALVVGMLFTWAGKRAEVSKG